MPSIFGFLEKIRRVDWRQEGWRDVLCVAFLAAATWHLAGADGGKLVGSVLPALFLGLGVVAATVPELTRMSRAVRWLVVGWSVGPILALIAAQVRAGWVSPVSTLALAVPCFLAARHLWRRPAGPVALGVILAAASLRAWGGAFMAYWGGGGGNAWLAVSWHNQSGTLMGAAALLGFGLTVGGRRGWTRVVGLALAGGAGAGVWLAASRAALVLTGLGLVVGGVAALRRLDRRRVVGSLVATLLAVVAATGALGRLAHGPGAGTERMVERGLERGNLVVRFDYWQGAWGMFREAPLTGTGPGSYRWASLPHASRNTPRTRSTHNEYLDALAGQGILGGFPVWLATFGAAWLVLLAMARPPSGAGARAPRDDAGVVAAAGVLALLGSHAGFDFDWDYPILLTAAAVAVGVLSLGVAGARRTPDPAERMKPANGASRWPPGAVLAAGCTAALLLLSSWGVALATSSGAPPWELDHRLRSAWDRASAGDIEQARASLAEARRWNPGAPSLPAVSAIVRHRAGELSHQELAERTLGFLHMDERILAAERLVEEEAWTEVGTVLDGLRPFLEERHRWRVQERVVRFVALTLELARNQGGCPAVREGWTREVRWAREIRVEEKALWEHLAERPDVRSCLEG